MTASADIGRVGGLAVALGIGAALTSGSAVAWADAGGSPSADSVGSSAATAPGVHASSATRSQAKSMPAGVGIMTGRVGTTPPVPTDTPLTSVMLAAARRETLGAVNARSTAATTSAAAVAPATKPTNLTGRFQLRVYTPIHTAVATWIASDLGKRVDGVINTLTGSYAIGNGAAGTAAHPTGSAGGWLLGDGGPGWNSVAVGVAGGAGGAAGLVGDGGPGGAGGPGAAGGIGGAGGRFMGVGGAGGPGGSGVAGGVGGAGGAGGPGVGVVIGIGGDGGPGGDGSDGGRGGNGGKGAAVLGSGGDGGDAGNSGVGGTPTGLPALGGAGGSAGLLGSHGAVGQSGRLVGGSLVAATAGGSVLQVSTTGTWLTNSNGQVLILHGVNEVYKVAPYEPAASGFSADDAAFPKANGFNVVRLGVLWTAVEPQPGVYDTAYLASIQQTVQTLGAQGIYTIIDMHQDSYSSTFAGEGAPAWATQTGGLPNPNFGFPGNYYLNPAENHAWDAFWSNSAAPNGSGLEDNYAQTWETVASTFSGNPDVIGYDVMNEPFPGTSWPATLLGSSFFSHQQLTPMYNQVDAAIRAVDPTTPLFIEPTNPAATEVGNILGAPVSLGTISDPNVVLAFHDYCGGLTGICKPIANALANAAQDYAAQHNIPAFMDEFGATTKTKELTDEMNASDQNLMSWAEWAYTGQGDITTTGSSGEALVYDPSLPPVGNNVNTTTLATLAAPYPQVISGTPNSWSYANGTFQFSYSTDKADGSGSFAVGSQTTISVPAVEFPNGYQVSVTGGHVVSDPNAPELVITSDAGATIIDVVVSTAA